MVVKKTSDGGRVVVDADELLERIDAVRGSLDELSSFLAKGLTTETSRPERRARAPPTQEWRKKAEKTSTEQPFELRGFDVNRLKWKAKGGELVGPDSGWAWAFSMDRDGFVLDEARPLVEAIERYGPEVVVGDYILKMSGRDGNLLSRRRLKT